MSPSFDVLHIPLETFTGPHVDSCGMDPGESIMAQSRSLFIKLGLSMLSVDKEDPVETEDPV